ncbi:type I-B CRISPR-associated protein Cas7/Csh2 [Petrimonas sulfuriphila]|jgi:CRISPR-associated protein Csh2|uniref:type I-B CRISPR-associated protein Cas7/Csh2 n=1 Tax=Petrimonas sulfuriphila TaxID=285070 RepID=UPI003EB80557|nr:type I-B CRISPR-associated protein Cas7/Csh2 [Bacteroidales bacterium]MDD4438502.1 type I-B CRISPR-associated protein Cas7/Csh2 [Tissierellia bacterium]
MSTLQEKSEIIFLYESKFSMPNGDPFTGEQRYDEETKKVLVSDVRIKRFIRDYLHNMGETIYVINDKEQAEGKESGSAARVKSLRKKFEEELKAAGLKKNDGLFLLTNCIDVRLFGGISTEKDAAVNITGPVQFALLNSSLNAVDLRMHQNTSVFSSDVTKSGGAIGTTSVVPYSLNQIHGWINPFAAEASGLTNNDVDKMFKALWLSINNANTRSKSNQSSLLLLQLVYNNNTDKVYGTDKLISFTSEKRDEQFRDISDLELNFEAIRAVAQSEKIKEVRYYTEYPKIKDKIAILGEKFKELNFD